MPIVRAILIVGSVGGSIKMVQEEDGRCRFRVFMSDESLTFLDTQEGGNVISRDSGWLDTWQAAIASFSKWPWTMLSPKYVHPEFSDRVMAAFAEVSEQMQLNPVKQKPAWLNACRRKEEYK